MVGFEPTTFRHEPSLITTRPGLPAKVPKVTQNFSSSISESVSQFNFDAASRVDPAGSDPVYPRFLFRESFIDWLRQAKATPLCRLKFEASIHFLFDQIALSEWSFLTFAPF